MSREENGGHPVSIRGLIACVGSRVTALCEAYTACFNHIEAQRTASMQLAERVQHQAEALRCLEEMAKGLSPIYHAILEARNAMIACSVSLVEDATEDDSFLRERMVDDGAK